MGLLTEIQNDALSDKTPVTTLLRKVMVLASELDSGLLEDWVRHELHGYPNDVQVPEYRILKLNFKVSGNNPGWRVTGQNVPSVLVCAALEDENFDLFKCRQAVGTIKEDEIRENGRALSINMDNQALFLHGKIFDRSFSISRFWADVPSSQVLGILDAIRNRTLEFALALKKKYPEADNGTGVSTKELSVEKAVSNIYYNTIHGNVGVAGNASNSTVNITVNHGNTQELREALAKYGVEDADFIELQAALNDEPDIDADKRFGPKVNNWVSKMMGKAGSGAWAVSLGAAGALLEKALLAYYGYN